MLKTGVIWGYDFSIVKHQRLITTDMFQQNGWQAACVGKWHSGLDLSKEDTLDYPVEFRKAVEKSPSPTALAYSCVTSALPNVPPYVYMQKGAVSIQPNRQTENIAEFGWWEIGQRGGDFLHQNVQQPFADKTVAPFITKWMGEIPTIMI